MTHENSKIVLEAVANHLRLVQKDYKFNKIEGKINEC